MQLLAQRRVDLACVYLAIDGDDDEREVLCQAGLEKWNLLR